MDTGSKQVNVDEARRALNLINRQKIEMSKAVRMPIWLNMYFSILACCVVFFKYLNDFMNVNVATDIYLFLFLFVSLFISHKKGVKQGIKLKLFPKTHLTTFMLLFGGFLGLFASHIARFLHQQIHPIMSVIFIVFIGSLLFYICHKYPLSEVIPDGGESEKR